MFPWRGGLGGAAVSNQAPANRFGRSDDLKSKRTPLGELPTNMVRARSNPPQTQRTFRPYQTEEYPPTEEMHIEPPPEKLYRQGVEFVPEDEPWFETEEEYIQLDSDASYSIQWPSFS